MHSNLTIGTDCSTKGSITVHAADNMMTDVASYRHCYKIMPKRLWTATLIAYLTHARIPISQNWIRECINVMKNENRRGVVSFQEEVGSGNG